MTRSDLETRNMQLVAAISAVRDIAESNAVDWADPQARLDAIKTICDEQIERGWMDPAGEEG